MKQIKDTDQNTKQEKKDKGDSMVGAVTKGYEENFAALLEESYKKNQRFREGQVVSGIVVSVLKDKVLVDIGYKSAGYVPIIEFYDLKNELHIKPGDTIDVYLEQAEDEEGNIILSKERADKMKIWDTIALAFEKGDLVKGRIIDKVKGGLSVDIGIKAFLPGSQIDLVPIRDLNSLLGKVYEFKLLKFSKKRGNIVLSRRAILEKERENQKRDILEHLDEGQVLEGIVKNITDYGAFIDLGGIDGLLHITDISWGRINHPSDVLSVGKKIDVKIIKYDRENQRVSLGLKQTTEDPWRHAVNKYHVGDKITGKVVNVTDYGIFIEIAEGVEGLVHVSEMSWTKKVKNPLRMYKVGDEIQALILDIEMESRRISMGVKQLETNPWEELAKKYPVGSRVKGKIQNMTDFGIFLDLGHEVDGLIHISDISWTKKIKHPEEHFKKGDTIDAQVLSIDVEHEKFALGIKQLTEDPWPSINEKFSRGKRVQGTVARITDLGVFVDLGDDLEGLVYASEIKRDQTDETNLTQFKVGDALEASVVSIDDRERKIGLSLKKLKESEERKDYQAFLEKQGSGDVSLQDSLGEKELEKLKKVVTNKSTRDEETK